MIAVAVIAGSDFRGDVGLAQGHGLAMISLAIMFEAVFVAFAAARVADGFKVFVFRIHDVMGGMAIGANRGARIAFGE